MLPLCTIVTITYNNVAGLRRTVNSLRPLAASGFQQVIVDGASTDGTLDWIRDNSAFPDTQVISEPDNGIYDAMNKGLTAARGQVCMFINAGDELLIGAKLKPLLSDFTRGQSEWLVGRAEIVQPGIDERSFEKPRRWDRYSWIRQTFVNYQVCHPATAVRTAALLELGGFDRSFRIAADFKLFVELGRRGPPSLSQALIARFERGGVSDVRFEESLMECHRARVESVPWVRRVRLLDAFWTRVTIMWHRIARLREA